MGRLIDTADINNVFMLEKSDYGMFAVEIDHIISGIVSKCPTIEPKTETVTEFADRCRECGARHGKLLKQSPLFLAFAKWVATEIFDENWEHNKDAFAEIACRKLAKLGIVRVNEDEWEWELVEPQESEDAE